MHFPARRHVRAVTPVFCFNRRTPGWVAEWFKAHAWKVCLGQKPNVGSNPTPSVKKPTTYARWLLIFLWLRASELQFLRPVAAGFSGPNAGLGGHGPT